VRLGYQPDALLAALAAADAHLLRRLLADADVCTKVCWAMATFSEYRPALLSEVMVAAAALDESHFSRYMKYEVVVALLLATRAGCALTVLQCAPSAAGMRAVCMTCPMLQFPGAVYRFLHTCKPVRPHGHADGVQPCAQGGHRRRARFRCAARGGDRAA
jgi:hypothetical protein